MLQEMKLEDALKKFLRGRKVLVMYDETLEADKPAFTVEPLEEMLKRNRFLVEVPAVENPDFKEAVHQMVTPEKMIPPPGAYPGRNRGSAYGNRKKLDAGVKRLYRIFTYPLRTLRKDKDLLHQTSA